MGPRQSDRAKKPVRINPKGQGLIWSNGCWIEEKAQVEPPAPAGGAKADLKENVASRRLYLWKVLNILVQLIEVGTVAR